MQRGASDLVGEHRGAAVVEQHQPPQMRSDQNKHTKSQPQHQDLNLGGSGAGAVANGSAVGLALLPEFPRGQLSLQPWPVSLPFPAPARQTVHAVLPHTAYRRSSPEAFDFPGPKGPGRDDDPIQADQAQVVG